MKKLRMFDQNSSKKTFKRDQKSLLEGSWEALGGPGRLRQVLGGPGGSWAILGGSWGGVLGGFGAALLGRSGRLLDGSWALWVALGARWAEELIFVDGSWTALGRLLGASRGPLGSC